MQSFSEIVPYRPVRKIERGDIYHRLRAHVKMGEVGVGDGIDGVRYDAVDVGGADTERGDTGEYVTSSHEVLRE